jgi:hypothetical protein
VELHVDDDGFVRAEAPRVYRRLTDIGAWDGWWPGLRSLAVDAPVEAWRLDLRPAPTRRLRLVARPRDWRLDTGFVLDLEGDLTGRAEFWLEPGWGGTVVHHLLTATTPRRRPLRVLEDYRRVLRRGLWAFKDLVQAEVLADELESAGGRRP